MTGRRRARFRVRQKGVDDEFSRTVEEFELYGYTVERLEWRMRTARGVRKHDFLRAADALAWRDGTDDRILFQATSWEGVSGHVRKILGHAQDGSPLSGASAEEALKPFELARLLSFLETWRARFVIIGWRARTEPNSDRPQIRQLVTTEPIRFELVTQKGKDQR